MQYVCSRVARGVLSITHSSASLHRPDTSVVSIAHPRRVAVFHSSWNVSIYVCVCALAYLYVSVCLLCAPGKHVKSAIESSSSDVSFATLINQSCITHTHTYTLFPSCSFHHISCCSWRYSFRLPQRCLRHTSHGLPERCLLVSASL